MAGRLRVGLDFRPALVAGAGIARYTRGLAAALAAAPEVDLHLYAHLAPGRRRRATPPPGARVHRLPVPSRLVRGLGRLGFGAELYFGRWDVFHFTDFAFLPFRRTPLVCTLHDLSFRVAPRWHEPRAVRALEKVTERLVRAARFVVTPSGFSAAEVTARLGVPAARVRVVPPGVEERFFAAAPAPALRRRYRLPPRFFLFVGTLEPRKNLPRLAAAFARVARHVPDVGLVVAGAPGWGLGPIRAALAGAGTAGRVRYLGYVPEADLPGLYRTALGFVYPSLYEGFGLPVLEALAAGAPTVTSARGALAETAGEAALLVDPEDTEALADALARLLADTALRERLAAAGPSRARRFTWAAAARRAVAVYREAVA